ncbi:MAG: hypothetical protein SNF33_02200 [Candidatus Algichlamydia australiensis]|nr:hypothetical protein [Chlamydiales bacterium]
MNQRELIQLAVKSGESFYHPESRFLHHKERIPLYQNFCYVLALLRMKQGETVELASDLLERLLAFQAEGFPIYLDQFPKCYSSEHQHKIFLTLDAIYKHFHSIMKPELKEKVERAVAKQSGFQVDSLAPIFHPKTFRVVGEHCRRGSDPKGTFEDLVLGCYLGKLSRWVKEDPWLLVEAARIFPQEQENLIEGDILIDPTGYEISWGDSEQNHSLLLPGFDENLCFTYSEEVPEGKSDRMEVNLYLNYHPDNSILVNGKKATTFQMSDCVEIHSKNRKIKLEFAPGEGRFFGHISRYNRPTQERRKEMFESYDWRIAVRTISRSKNCSLSVRYSTS